MRLSRAVFLLILSGVLFTAETVAAGDHGDAEARQYLALGDSLVFGYITQAGFAYVNPDNFVGHPEYLGRMLRFDTVNAACPGETTGSSLSFAEDDVGCRAFRSKFPLHVTYDSTQLDFATRFLRRHREVRLVTIGLGANDVALLLNSCAGDTQCINAGLPQVLAQVQFNMQTILARLRAARFRGVIVVMNYFSLDYTDPAGTGLVELLNHALSGAAMDDGAVIADVFSAFLAVADRVAGGQTCEAGLLNAYPGNQLQCDAHPSQSGQRLIAETIARAYRAAVHENDDHD
jgi:lysophospholipase L1-like esterase